MWFSGEVFAAGGQENLRIVRGRVGITGAVREGTGFTVLNDVTGFYLITFTTLFADLPAVTANADITTTPGAFSACMFNGVTTGVARVVINGVDNNVFRNSGFYFIAIGPR